MKLIEPIDINLAFDDGSKRQLEGLYTINQDPLKKLPDDKIVDLFHRGYLQVIYLMIASLKQVPVLAQKKNSRLARMMQSRRRNRWRGPDARAVSAKWCRAAALCCCADWSATGRRSQAGRRSPAAFRDYLGRFDAGGEMEAFFGAPEIAGKYYYGEDLEGFNFERRQMRFGVGAGCHHRRVWASRRRESIYVGSLPVSDYLPGLSGGKCHAACSGRGPRIWLGHACDVSAHYDTVDNLACVVAGTRRFTLYAPELMGRLYAGPIDHTMAGQPVSLAASMPTDDARFPLFRDVREQALVAELEPGDALYLPKLWWHQVQSTAPFNGLVNYWWDAFAGGPDAPYTAMLLAMITIAERPLAERQAWKALVRPLCLSRSRPSPGASAGGAARHAGSAEAELRPHPRPRDAADAGIDDARTLRRPFHVRRPAQRRRVSGSARSSSPSASACICRCS